MTTLEKPKAHRAVRTGPLGRLARLVLGAAMAWLVYELVTDRTDIWDPPTPLLSPGMAILATFTLFAVVHLGETLHARKPVFRSVFTLFVGTGVAAVITSGHLWAEPFTWFIWGVGMLGAGATAIAFALAMVLGTPGCEHGALRELAWRLRGRPDREEPMWCWAGLHVLDEWETRMPWHRSR